MNTPERLRTRNPVWATTFIELAIPFAFGQLQTFLCSCTSSPKPASPRVGRSHQHEKTDSSVGSHRPNGPVRDTSVSRPRDRWGPGRGGLDSHHDLPSLPGLQGMRPPAEGVRESHEGLCFWGLKWRVRPSKTTVRNGSIQKKWCVCV